MRAPEPKVGSGAHSDPGGVALTVALLTACALATPWIHTTGVVILGVLGFVLLPIFAAMLQSAANELVDSDQHTRQTPATAI